MRREGGWEIGRVGGREGGVPPSHTFSLIGSLACSVLGHCCRAVLVFRGKSDVPVDPKSSSFVLCSSLDPKAKIAAIYV